MRTYTLLFTKITGPQIFAMLTLLTAISVFPTIDCAASTITVNSTADITADDGQCTLREAIISANTNIGSGTPGECAAGSSIGADIIAFSIGSGAQTITLESLLPPVTSPVTIDGTTQPGYAPGKGMIRVDAGGLFISVLSLDSGSTGSTVKGMMITRSTSYGINAISGNNTFQGNYIGSDGSTALGCGYALHLFGSNNLIGGTEANQGNLLSGSSGSNIMLQTFSNNNIIQGNIIGTDATGSISLSTGTGITIVGSNTIVGGTTAGSGNLISGNNVGILLRFPNTTIQGNKIGTNAFGTAAVSGSNYGIWFFSDARDNAIGGAESGASNLISGNSVAGIYIQGNSATGNVIQGNYIGTNTIGNAAIPNGIGIWSESGTSTTIGGSNTGQGNLISGNTNQGILMQGGNNNTVQGNKIGTTSSGRTVLANIIGLEISGSGNTTVGGPFAGQGNLVSGNTQNGIIIRSAAFSTTIQGNYIGTNAAGTSALPNANGILIESAPNSTIGGLLAGQSNLISGNTNLGVQIGFSSGHVVTGNKIGTDAVGSGSLPNGDIGMYLTGTASAQVSQNLIAHHNGIGDFGVYLDSGALFAAGSTDNCLISNSTGVQNNTGSSMNFTSNWWGHTSGPYVAGAGTGTGDPVSTNVVFDPWLIVPPTACEPILTVYLTGTGGGTVTSAPQGTNPVGIACTSGACSSTFLFDTPVELTSTADNISTFGIWDGECSGSGVCSFNMTDPKAVTANFVLAPKAMILTIGFPTLAKAHKAAAASGDIILTIDSEMPDSGLNINETFAGGKSVAIKGGYYADYTKGRSGLPTYLRGPLYISSGTLRVDRLTIR